MVGVFVSLEEVKKIRLMRFTGFANMRSQTLY
jgi:hypothetical protein